MRNAFIFARREFLERVRTKSFLFTTIFFPLMMVGLTLVPAIMMNKSTGAKRVEVVAGTQAMAEMIANNLRNISGKLRDGSQFAVSVTTDSSDASRDVLLKRITDKQANDHLDGVVWATDDLIAKGNPIYYGVAASDFKTQADIEQSINRAVQIRRLAEKGIAVNEVEAFMKRIDLEVHPVSNGQAKEAAGVDAFFTPLLLMLMMYISMLIYGMAVMRSVLEEKSSKIFEVMLSVATAKELMAGKVLGVGAVGLLQIAIWAVAGLVTSGPFAIAANSMLRFSSTQFIYFGIFFILGYLLYSALFAAVGAMVNSEQEAQQLQTWVMLPLIFCMVFMTKVISDPNSSVALWASLFPMTSPLLMYVRIVVQQPPLWQIGTAIAIEVATVYLLVSICSRIYRVGILLYGKRPTLPEIVKWIRYA
jgi:ABC-2 type transport system permease protein